MSKAAIIRLTLLFLILAGLGLWTRQLMSGSSVEQLNEQARILEAIYTQGNYIEAGIWGVFAAGIKIPPNATKYPTYRGRHNLIVLS